MSSKKDNSIPPREEFLTRLGFDYLPDFIYHYEEVFDSMLLVCSIDFVLKIAKIAKLQYDRSYKKLFNQPKYEGLEHIVEEDEELSDFFEYGMDLKELKKLLADEALHGQIDLDGDEVNESFLSLPAKSQLLETLRYCHENSDTDDQNYKSFVLLLKRIEALSTNNIVLGQLISEVIQSSEYSIDWEDKRNELLRRKESEMHHKDGEYRIRNVKGPRNERNYNYWVSEKDYDSFCRYRERLANSDCFTLAEWIWTYRPFKNHE